jgi:hypothetical protein
MVLRSLGMASGDMEPPTRRSRAQDIPMVMHRFVFQPATPENDGTLSTPAILSLWSDRTVTFNDSPRHGVWMQESDNVLCVQFHCRGEEARVKTTRYLRVANLEVWLSTTLAPWNSILIRQ